MSSTLPAYSNYSLFGRQWHGMVHLNSRVLKTRKMPSSPRWTMSCGSTTSLKENWISVTDMLDYGSKSRVSVVLPSAMLWLELWN